MTKRAEQSEYPSRNNARYIEFLMEIMPTEQLNPEDVAEMRKRFKRYLEICATYDMKVGNLNAYLAIGINKKQAFDWVHGPQAAQFPERALFVEQVQALCGGYRETMMQDGKVNPVTGIFWQKNFDGLRDVQETITTTKSVLGDLPDMAKLQQKYLDNAHCAELSIPEKSQKEPVKRGRKAQKD